MDAVPIVRTAIEGERARGSGGVVFVQRSLGRATYQLTSEIPNPELRENVESLLSECGETHLLCLEEVDRAVHLWKIPRAEVADRLLREAAA